ncbi:hypothetical protein F4775DRAFT_603316 [Biscogniauxia sp. FL1348]|nr:hypothetical protein F4775DRAFT_603316 [Biscogniauxia sp. FL1348]
MSERIRKADLALLRSQVHIRTTTTTADQKANSSTSSYRSITVTRGPCRITIHATKPLPDPLLLAPPPPSFPSAYVDVHHGDCTCAPFALTPHTLFAAWQRVADHLRYGAGPEIWPAFAGDGEGDGESYETAEALAGAVLVAKMGVRGSWPGGFEGLAGELGVREEGEDGEEGDGLEEGEVVDDGGEWELEEGEIVEDGGEEVGEGDLDGLLFEYSDELNEWTAAQWGGNTEW